MTCLTRSSRVRRGVKQSHGETMEAASYSTQICDLTSDLHVGYGYLISPVSARITNTR